MTDLMFRPQGDLVAADPRDEAERTAGMVIYGLYLAAPLSAGVTGLIGMLMASSRRKRAGALSATHFRYQVWSFWSALGAAATGGFWAATGSWATLADRTGGGLVFAGAALATVASVGFVGAAAYGLSRIAARDPIGGDSEG